MSSSLAVIDESNQFYQNFIESIKSQATRSIYKYCISKYLQYKNYTDISQLFTKTDNSGSKWIESDIIGYVVYLKKVRKISYATIALYIKAVIQFYSINDIQLNKRKIARYYGEHVKVVKDRAYTTQEIHKLLEFCDERTRCLVLLLASTGMRIGAVPRLKIGDVGEKIQDIYKITVYDRSKEEYYTFCTPECANAIDSYLEYRKRYGEKITENSPLFREQFDINDIDKIRNPKFISESTLLKLLDDVLCRSGLRERTKAVEGEARGRVRKQVARAHGFRKFATTNMVRAKVNAEAREMLLGHSIGLSDSYYRPDSSEILEEYLKAVDLLTINEENRLKKQVKQMTVDLDRYAKIQEQIDRINAKLA